ncbi:MAG TPA: hypothetical protein VLR50_15370 [Desulfobacterales bacterium]|nr:hypothetical protein [Desulfobacterales bacterium]
MTSSYQAEQLEALSRVRLHLTSLSRGEKEKLFALTADYLAFRRRVDEFQGRNFENVCERTCYQSRLSACCSREGIVTFFADVVINLLVSAESEIEALIQALQRENDGFKCVYLGPAGCRWSVKPIVCEMFLCDAAKTRVFTQHPEAAAEWTELERQRKSFTWPDRPVLFDMIEKYFIAADCASSLMYLNNSPGLLRVKRQAGI